MSCQRLVCANCARPVSEGACPTCRRARAELHSHSPWSAFSPAVLVSLVLAVVAALLLTVAHATA
jgi:hypothetical protein